MPRATSGTDAHVYNFIDHMTPFFCRNNIHPNVVTLFGTALNFLVLSPRLSPVQKIAVVVAVRFLDCLDGQVARQCKKSSKFGSYLDSAMDVTSLVTILMVAFKIKPTVQTFLLMSSVIFAAGCMVGDPATHEMDEWLKPFVDNSLPLGALVGYWAFIAMQGQS
jgi:hypothetical protein